MPPQNVLARHHSLGDGRPGSTHWLVPLKLAFCVVPRIPTTPAGRAVMPSWRRWEEQTAGAQAWLAGDVVCRGAARPTRPLGRTKQLSRRNNEQGGASRSGFIFPRNGFQQKRGHFACGPSSLRCAPNIPRWALGCDGAVRATTLSAPNPVLEILRPTLRLRVRLRGRRWWNGWEIHRLPPPRVILVKSDDVEVMFSFGCATTIYEETAVIESFKNDSVARHGEGLRG